ncbi:MAG: DNA polymerase, partial [Patescibacteria group bacterium]
MASKNTTGGKKKLVLFDAHAILHRGYHALPQFASSRGEPTGALYGLSTMVMKIIDELKPDYMAACYDLPGGTFRHEAYKDYKAGRKEVDSELVEQMKRSYDVWSAFSVPIYEMPGFEADDILGTIVELTKKNKNLQVVIASGDMDTLQLVEGDRVLVYTLKKGLSDTIIYDERQVKERFGFPPELLPDYKGLRGDPSDNIVGIQGIGEKTATTLISNLGSIEEIYKVLKKDKKRLEKLGITARVQELLKNGEEEAEFSKTLATIRRDAPIKFGLPEKFWQEEVSYERVATLFRELEFRSLITRVDKLLKKNGVTTETLFTPEELVPEKDLRETTVALSLLDPSNSSPTQEEILSYARVKDFTKAKEIILQEIKKKNLEYVYEEMEKPLIPVVKKMEERGISVDVKYLAGLSKEYHKELSKLEKNIHKSAGEEFNINSPKQLGDILFERLALVIKNHKKTEGGVRSTKESELEKLRDTHPIIPLILEYRELQKLLSTYIDAIPPLVQADGRVHAKILQIGAATGRMATKDPSLHNIPIKSDLGKRIRDAFTTPKGFTLVSLDYSQIELRIAAILSKDPTLINIFKSGRDVHNEVASKVFGVKSDEVTKDMRRKAKVINFGVLYGMGVNALRTNLGGTRQEAQEFYNQYFATFPVLAKYLDKVKAEADRNGYTSTLFGRRRPFSGFRSPLPYIRAQAERMAINAPIQGTSADILKIAMVRIDKMLEKEKLSDKVFMLLSIHDELIFEMEKG